MTVRLGLDSLTSGSGLASHALRALRAMLPFVLLATIWQFATLFFPPYLFPSLIDVFWRCLEILIVDFREELTLDFH